jgi:hypothetical protein
MMPRNSADCLCETGRAVNEIYRANLDVLRAKPSTTMTRAIYLQGE